MVIIKHRSDGQREAGCVSSVAGLMTVTGDTKDLAPLWYPHIFVTTMRGHSCVGDLEESEEEDSQVEVSCWVGSQIG